AARLAGCPRGTLARRAAEGLERLRLIMHRRRVVFSSAMLVALMSSEAQAALPASVAAVPKVVIGGLAASSPAALLAESAARGLFWTKVKALSAGLLAMCTISAGVTAALLAVPPSAERDFTPQAAVDIGLPR